MQVDREEEREAIARIIEPASWRARDACLRPYSENRGAFQGEQYWYERTYRAGCRTEEDATAWWAIYGDTAIEPYTLVLFRDSLRKADAILALRTKESHHDAR